MSSRKFTVYETEFVVAVYCCLVIDYSFFFCFEYLIIITATH